jgi:membrane-associated phospholipid phosphatase
MRRWIRFSVLFSLVLVQRMIAQVDSERQPEATSSPASAQTSQDESTRGYLPPGEDAENRLVSPFAKHLLHDQKDFWTKPFHLRWSDAKIIAPFAAFTGLLLANDAAISRQVPASEVNRSKTFSDYGAYSLIGAAGGAYLMGLFTKNEHLRETGFLAGEAALNSTAVSYLLKEITQRSRPYQGNGNGNFFSGGSSFPSEHSAIAWSIASVFAHEYPGPLTQTAAYGLASAITVARVTGKQHFASDAVVGAALGWYFARQIYRAHHDPEIGGTGWGSLVDDTEHNDGPHNPARMASPYVPLDSWIYPAIERLVALGYINNAFLDSRPWTRIHTAELVQEAKDQIDLDEAPNEIAKLETQLHEEFAYEFRLLDGDENRIARVESVYSGSTQISGKPLNDSYHFGQTLINNFGRPYQEGFNANDGFSTWAAAGPFTIYSRGEYQHSPWAPPYPALALQAIATADNTPLQPPTPFSKVDQFRLLDTYVSAHVGSYDLSFGKQSLWWGPAEGGSLILSDNAEPMYMFRAAQTPFRLPWIFEHLGPIKLDFFFGKLSGNGFPPGPVIHGEKISLKPTRYLELGFTRTSELGGVGRPLTAGAIFNSYFGLKASGSYSANANPGKRSGDFDFTYKLPHLRNWASIYAEMFDPQANYFNVDTNPSPIYTPQRLAIRQGLYLAQIPRLHKLDLRVEAVYTNPPTSRSQDGKYVYWDFFYRDLYTNKNNLIGDWIGREGMGFQGWSTYWFGPKTSLQLGYRHAKVANDFIPGGETLNDGSAKLQWWPRADLGFSTTLQYEKWLAPVLAPVPQTNWTSAIQISVRPYGWLRPQHSIH